MGAVVVRVVDVSVIFRSVLRKCPFIAISVEGILMISTVLVISQPWLACALKSGGECSAFSLGSDLCAENMLLLWAQISLNGGNRFHAIANACTVANISRPRSMYPIMAFSIIFI